MFFKLMFIWIKLIKKYIAYGNGEEDSHLWSILVKYWSKIT